MSASECRILVVDDNEDNRYTLIRRLRREGYTDVVTAGDGREAMGRLAETDFDLMLLDIMMPEMDGYSVLEKLRASGRLASLPVIVISAIDDFDSVVRCIEMGAEDYLRKPFNATLLKARIAGVLEKKRLRDEVARQLAVIEPVEKHGGVVNQFQGDAMLITFNVPVADPEHADRAACAALEMQQAVEGKTFAGVQLKTRIGIATGKVIAGNVGSGGRMNYTVHGDAVNLAARLEQLNKEHGTRILVSAETVSLLKGDYRIESMGAMSVRGKSAPVDIRALWDF